LERNFVEAFERLVRANAAYDQGHVGEAPNIAKEVYNFLYDHGTTVSILTLLGLKANLLFLSTSAPRQTESLPAGAVLVSPEYRLIEATIGFDGMDYEPHLERALSLKRLFFKSWYDETILAWHGREDIKRGEVIEFFRNYEGGGHVKKSMPRSAKMAGLIRGDWVDGYMVLGNGVPVEPDLRAPICATARQIGWELEETLRQGCPALTLRANLAPAPGPSMRPARPRSR
jgi:hypothetical protein